MNINKHPLYIRWVEMRRRCRDPKRHDWKFYGGRGITVCERWEDFRNFCDDMESTYRPGLTIERKDSDGPYSPENCKWAGHKEQNRNRRDYNRRLTFNGETLTLSEWAERLGHKGSATLWRRLLLGWSVEEALTSPIQIEKRNGRTLTFNSKTQTIAQWARELRLNPMTITSRLNRSGWSVERTLGTP